MLSVVDVVAAGCEPSPGESVVRDQQDWPIIRAARGGGCDVIITGDHDVLDAGLRHPLAVSPGAWLAGEQARPLSGGMASSLLARSRRAAWHLISEVPAAMVV